MRIPIASDAWRFVIPLGIACVFLFWFGQWWSGVLGIICALAAVFCLFFFRDFDRDVPEGADAILSPGDGKILAVDESSSPEFPGGKVIRIFLSIFDGHVQRLPVGGKVEKMVYRKGTFLDARDPKAHLENERHEVVLVSDRGRVSVTQIAGLVARRIKWWIAEGETVTKGDRYGLIRFGSQVDLLLPSHAEVLVKAGDRVLAGETEIARWRS